MQNIAEEDGIHKAWYERAREIRDIGQLTDFIKALTTEYNHDYGTICHAIAAAAIAAAFCVERSPQGGITGFQSGAVMWEFIQHWQSHLQGRPLRLLNYEDALYPQSGHRFTTISQGALKWLREEAKKQLAEHAGDSLVHPDVLAHWISLAAGEVPFGLNVEED